MRITSKDTSFNQPILKIREVLQCAMKERLNGDSKKKLYEKVATLLDQSVIVAKNVITQLVEHGYLEANKEYRYSLSTTIKGRQLGIAKAIPPISREKAKKMLNELIERAKAINENNELVYYVVHLKVFGSYLSDVDTLSDLDIGFKLAPKYKGVKFTKESRKRVEHAMVNGKQFNNLIDELSWPHLEVVRLLKSRKRSLSLHEEGCDQILDMVKSRIIFKHDK